MSVDIGGRLRFVRARHKLSQRELAKRSGVTNSTISLIESNQMNPSVGALKRILDGLPMGLAEFFAIEPERPRKAFYRADELTEIGKKPISFRQVGDNLFGRSLQILKALEHFDLSELPPWGAEYFHLFASAAKLAWQRTIDFFNKHLR